MSFDLPDHWVWDFWTADDGAQTHLYYLHAPRSLGDPHLRHRNARIGHATSTDLRTWVDHGPVLEPGGPGAVDADATWTGSIVRADDGEWQMFYTGSRFLAADAHANIETVAVAVSRDLHSWRTAPERSLSAPFGQYETLGSSVWPEEAWRDPWVMREPDGTWSMLLTARSVDGEDELDRGVVGLALSPDLVTWTTAPPRSAPGAGFRHIEVPQIVEIDGHRVLLFSCDTAALAGRRERAGGPGGVWWVELGGPGEPYPVERAQLLVDDRLYAGRLVRDRDGGLNLLAFRNVDAAGDFGGGLTDPMPVAWRDGALRMAPAAVPA